MNYSPKQGVRSHGLPHDPFKSSTVPRPIGWISTVSKDGKDNLAPYSQYQNLTWDPLWLCSQQINLFLVIMSVKIQ